MFQRINQIGKQGKINQRANRILAKYWQENNITECEIKLEGCLRNWLLQNCHRNKRIFYKENPEIKLWDTEQVVRACQCCHNLVENNTILREKCFNKSLRNRN